MPRPDKSFDAHDGDVGRVGDATGVEQDDVLAYLNSLKPPKEV